MATMQARLAAFISAVGADIKALQDGLPPPGSGFGDEIAYAEKTTNHTSTNVTAYGLTGDAIISGLSIVVEGTGRPWDLEFFSQVRHSVAGTIVAATIVEDGVAEGTLMPVYSPSTTINVACLLRERMPPIDIGVSKTYQIASYASAAGTVTWAASIANRQWLSAVGR
jgi:hypothetical protein